MIGSETYRKGVAIRRKLRGDVDFASNQSTYDRDPVMKKFIDVATETVEKRPLTTWRNCNPRTVAGAAIRRGATSVPSIRPRCR
jgi:hypothetical protein